MSSLAYASADNKNKIHNDGGRMESPHGVNGMQFIGDAEHPLPNRVIAKLRWQEPAQPVRLMGKLAGMPPPVFHSAKNGYNMQEVDEYVDSMLAVNERLIKINGQLYRLWLMERHANIPIVRTNNALGGTVEPNRVYGLIEENRGFVDFYKENPPIVQEQGPVLDGAKEQPSRIKAFVNGLMFYAMLISLVLGAFLVSSANDTGAPQNVLGFSAMTVLTRSMQSEIPQHSLIITRMVDPATIQIGDDITYMVRGNRTITHRVIDIHENYAGSGMRGFETQGIMNPRPDAEIVPEVNIVGRVIFHSFAIGRVIVFIRGNLVPIGIVVGFMTVIGIAFRIGFLNNPAMREAFANKFKRKAVRVKA